MAEEESENEGGVVHSERDECLLGMTRVRAHSQPQKIQGLSEQEA
jgi:hypothetical protein